jgi:hypothetical protein
MGEPIDSVMLVISSVLGGAFFGALASFLLFWVIIIISEVKYKDFSFIEAALLLSVFGVGAFYSFKIAKEICIENSIFCIAFLCSFIVIMKSFFKKG